MIFFCFNKPCIIALGESSNRLEAQQNCIVHDKNEMFICNERGGKKSESQTGIVPMASQIPLLGALTTKLRETLGKLGQLLGSHVTRVLHTARISNVDVIIIMCNK